MKIHFPTSLLAHPTIRIFAAASLLTALSLGFLPRQAVQAATVLYAKPVASGTGDCSSWTNACALQTAGAAAVSGDEIWVAKGTYKPTSGTNRSVTFLLDSGVAIYGGFAGGETQRSQRNPITNVTILSGDIGGAGHNDNSYHVVTAIDTDATAVLDGFTVTGGYANGATNADKDGGGMLSLSSSPTLTGLTFSGNSANEGGGIYSYDGNPKLTNVTLSGNSANNGGGGIYNDSGNVTLTNVTFSDNSASGGDGGGMYAAGYMNTLEHVTFSDNSASDSGGGIYASSGNFTLTDVTFSGNSATSAGGGYYTTTGNFTLTDVVFSDNSAGGADGAGGGLYSGKYCEYAELPCSPSFGTLANVTFNNNHATTDGGGICTVGVFSLESVSFNGNSAGGKGGGMYNGDLLSLTDVTFSANTADQGGGLYNNYSKYISTTLSNVTFSGNSATSYGGGMYSFNGYDDSSYSLSLTNITFRGNSANQGGGIYNWNGSPVIGSPIILDSLLWGNTASGGGAQIYNDDSTPTITYSDVQGGCPAGSTCSNNIDLNPLLGSLGGYSGGTQVFPLLPGSPAIDAGENSTCAFYDQRGVSRPQGAHCDMGAFESQGFSLTITGGNNQIALLNTAFATPLRLSVTSAYDEPVNGGKITFTPPSSGASAVLSSTSVTITGGAASVTATANGVLGAYTVSASASGVASPAAFHLTNSLTLFTATRTPTATRTTTRTPTPTSTRTKTATPGSNKIYLPLIVKEASRNLALGQPATASSIENSNYPAINAVDGNTTTRWSSLYSDPQWIQVDLGANYHVNRVVLNWEAAYGVAYQIQISGNGSAWTTVYSTTNGDGGIDDLSVSGTGRYVRMYGTSRVVIGGNSYGYSLYEFEVYGVP